MKKTLTVNLGGTVYHIDDDAYRLLDNYLSNLKQFFRKQEGAEEIVNDIENRIAELFAERVSAGKQVITIEDVEEIIARVGKPEDFGVSEEEEAEGNQKKQSTASGHSQSAQGSARSTTGSSIPRRLFRDPDNKLLGGVAAGVAAYLDWDITLVRILMIVLLFVPYCPMIIPYIIGWIIIPEAHTAAEKLSMRGEAVTVENIGKTVTDGFEKVADGVNNFVNSGKPRTFLQKVGDAFVNIAAIILKIFLVALIIICCPVLFVLAVVIVALVFAAIAALVGGGALLYKMIPVVDWSPIASISPAMTLLGTIAGVTLVAIPLGAFLYTILRQFFHWSPMGSGLKWSLFILWIVSLVLVIVNLSMIGWQIPLYGLHCF